MAANKTVTRLSLISLNLFGPILLVAVCIANTYQPIVAWPDIPTIDLPDKIAPPASMSAPTIRRRIADEHIETAHEPMKLASLSMIRDIEMPDARLMDVAQAVGIGKTAVKPLPEGQPGGRVIGRGKDIQGVLRFPQIYHNLAGWRESQTALINLTKWLNTQTEIKIDMNVEGGAARPNDPRLSKSPLIIIREENR